MSIELFLVPMQGDGLSRETGFDARYRNDPAVANSDYIPYSNSTVAILLLNATQVYLDTVAAQPDVTRLATQSNINTPITTNQANVFKSLMDGIFVPDVVANAGDTRKEVIHKTSCMFILSQKFQGLFGESWQQKAQARGVTLNSTWQEFPQALKDELNQVINSHKKWRNLILSNAATSGEILTALIARRSSPIYFAGIAF